MLDLLYLIAIVAFFSLMLWYVSGCARVGRPSSERDEEPRA